MPEDLAPEEAEKAAEKPAEAAETAETATEDRLGKFLEEEKAWRQASQKQLEDISTSLQKLTTASTTPVSPSPESTVETAEKATKQAVETAGKAPELAIDLDPVDVTAVTKRRRGMLRRKRK